MLKKFYSLMKPGIIYGNLITVTGGFFLASKGDINLVLYLYTLLGISLIIGSGCVFNNLIDRDIDHIMERTKKRVLVTGEISGKAAIVFGIFLGIIGTLILWLKTNLLTVIVALTGLFVYVILYSLWLKRSSIHGTIIGSVSGAVPPVVGYCAVTNNFDTGAIILFIILSIWQMPHSYAIAIYRFEDYKKASISVLPVKKGILFTKVNMLVYVIAFVIAALMLYFYRYTGLIYALVTTIVGLSWIWLSISGFKTTNDRIWARRMFIFSVLFITILSVTMAIDVIKPNLTPPNNLLKL